MTRPSTEAARRRYSDQIIRPAGALFLGCCLMAGSPSPHAQLSEDQRRIIVSSPAQASQFILRLEDLPAESTIASGLTYATKQFGLVQVSPDGRRAAFSTMGHHSMVGLVNLQTEKLTEIDLIAEGDVLALHWSPDSRFMAYEILPASGYRRVKVYDAQTMSARPLDVPEGDPRVHVAFQGWDEPAWLQLIVTGIPSQRQQTFSSDLVAD